MKYLALARKYGAEYGVDPYLMLAYCKHESGFNPSIYNIGCRKKHGANAWKYCTTGLAQLPPRYYKCPSCNDTCNTSEACAADLKNPEINLQLLAKSWSKMKNKGWSDWEVIIASNWGYGHFVCYKKGKTLDLKKSSSTYGKCISPARSIRSGSVSYANSVIALRDQYKSCLSGVTAPPWTGDSDSVGPPYALLALGAALVGGLGWWLYTTRRR